MTIKEFRKKFPVLDRKVYGKPLVYLDNAATSQRPEYIMEELKTYSLQNNANIHRAVHALSSEATSLYEEARDSVCRYLNARSREEIIFTSGATASINLLAGSFTQAFVSNGDEIIVGESEHHSDIVPWQLACQKTGAVLKVLPIDENGFLTPEKLSEVITDKTRLVCVAHISNVLGLVNPVRELAELAHSKGAKILVDGAQGIVHCAVDVQDLDCDFYAFSGHKIYAATGTGVLYGKKELLEAMPPYMGGGEMIASVSWTETTYGNLPYKFEAGTPNINSIPTLKSSMELLQSLRQDEELRQESELVKKMVYEALSSDERIILYGTCEDMEKKAPVFSFTVKGAHHEDLALILDKMGVAVRSGHMCAEPLMDRFGVSGMLRVSFAPYNTMEEAEYFLKSLDKAISMLV